MQPLGITYGLMTKYNHETKRIEPEVMEIKALARAPTFGGYNASINTLDKTLAKGLAAENA